MTVNGPIFPSAPTLPRGPHALSREEVRASQADRLGAAIAALVAEAGYGDVTIGEIAGRAGVSRATFYEHHRNKEACYLAAYLRFGAVLSERLADAVDPHDGWQRAVERLLTVYLGTLDADPAAARAFVLEIDGAGPGPRAAARKVHARMAAFVRTRHEAMQRRDPSLGRLTPEAYLALVHGARGVIRDVLDTEASPQLLDLLPSLRSWVEAFIRGADPSAEARVLP